MSVRYGVEELKWKDWTFYLVATERGLSYVDVEKPKLIGSLDVNARWMKPYLSAFEDYLSGKRTSLNVPFDIREGTDFQRRVWKALLTIPYGEWRSYSEIANMIEEPKAVRAVGGAIGKNPILIAIPCHRVLGKNRTLTGFSSGIELKRNLLDLEKIPYIDG